MHSAEDRQDTLPAKDAKKDAVDEKVIRALVDDLGHDSFEKRELAEKRLEAVGEPALRLLREAAHQSSDFEVRERAEKLIAGIESNLFPFMWSIRGHKMRATRIVLTPDGKQFASWGDDMRVYFWDAATGKAMEDYRLQPQGIQLPPEEDAGHDPFEFSPQAGFFSPDAKSFMLLLGGDKAGNWERWYKENIPLAIQLYIDYTSDEEE